MKAALLFVAVLALLFSAPDPPAAPPDEADACSAPCYVVGFEADESGRVCPVYYCPCGDTTARACEE